MIISRTITLHSLETAANLFIQKTMVLSFSCAAVSRASRQALTRDSCKSPTTQWKIPSEGKRDREEEVKGERKKEKSQEKKEGKKLTINICHQLELYFTTHHHPPPPPTHTHTHTQLTCGRKVMSLCNNVFSQSTLFRETEFVQ